MSDPRPKFEIVPDEPVAAPEKSTFELDLLVQALRALSQRTIIALSKIGVLLMVASVFALAMSMQSPNVYQLIMLGLYSAFVLAVSWILRSK